MNGITNLLIINIISMSNRISALAIFTCFVFIACDSNETITPSLEVTEGLQEYVERFESEAAARGIAIDVDRLGVQVSFADIPETNVLGVCYYHSNAPGRIEIDQPSWLRLSDFGREYVVFHELGHCILGRGHTESQYTNGSCKSIMASGTGNCYENYTTTTRVHYINELFTSL